MTTTATKYRALAGFNYRPVASEEHEVRVEADEVVHLPDHVVKELRPQGVVEAEKKA